MSNVLVIHLDYRLEKDLLYYLRFMFQLGSWSEGDGHPSAEMVPFEALRISLVKAS